jgi:hypothetical protein
MLREKLECCKPNFLLIEDRLDLGLRGPLIYHECIIIMHNMIIEDVRGQDNDCLPYELMANQFECIGEKREWPSLLPPTKLFGRRELILNFRMI